jgi:hypothetical protein
MAPTQKNFIPDPAVIAEVKRDPATGKISLEDAVKILRENNRVMRNVLDHHESQVKQLERDIKAAGVSQKTEPYWKGLYAEHNIVSAMTNRHVLNALDCCFRRDARYTWNPERMKQFGWLIMEAQKRGLSVDIPEEV